MTPVTHSMVSILLLDRWLCTSGTCTSVLPRTAAASDIALLASCSCRKQTLCHRACMPESIIALSLKTAYALSEAVQALGDK